MTNFEDMMKKWSKMSIAERLAQEQFFSFKSRLNEIMLEIEKEHKSAFMQGYEKGEADAKFCCDQLTRAKDLIRRMLPLMPSGYNDMGNSDFIWETKQAAEEFLSRITDEEVSE